MQGRVRIKFGSYEGRLGTLRPDLGASAQFTYVKPDNAAAPILLRADEYEQAFNRKVRVLLDGRYEGVLGDIPYAPAASMLYPGECVYEVILYPGDESDGVWAIPLRPSEFEDVL